MTDKDKLSQENTPDTTTAVFRKRASDLAHRKTEKPSDIKRIPTLVFYVGKEQYALKLEDLSCILPYANCTWLPKSDKSILGVINRQAELHCIIDLSSLMGFTDLPGEDERGYVIILKQGGLGLRVHQLDQIHYFQEKDLDGFGSPPHEMKTKFGKSILQNGIILLDIPKIFTHPLFAKK